jgi:hypothetical protein
LDDEDEGCTPEDAPDAHVISSTIVLGPFEAEINVS